MAGYFEVRVPTTFIWALAVMITAIVVGIVVWPDPSHPECPHDPRVGDKQWTFGLVGENIDIPEFHDCQRFIVVDPATFDSSYIDLYAIYAARDLVTFDVAEGVPQTPRAVAIIHSYAESAEYLPLHLKPGFSCLYLEWKGSTWVSWITATNSTYCSSEPDTISPRDTLQVVPVPRDTLKRAVPPVARWDWDEVRSEQYMGVRCGKYDWCEIGKPGFTSSPPLPIPPNAQQLDTTYHLVKGWYDQQLLAVADDDESNPLGVKPSNTMGTIVPKAYKLSNVMEELENGVDVAIIYITTDLYASKLNLLTALPGAATPNYLRLVKPTGGSYEEMMAKETHTWTAQFVSTSGTVLTATAIRRHPSSYSEDAPLWMPRTARWRWSKHDEGTWSECMSFCCEGCKTGTPGCEN